MFSNYQWLLIGVIIACSCLVIYGSSSTSIKEGLIKYREIPSNDPNTNSGMGAPGQYGSGTCESHGMQTITSLDECKTAGEALGWPDFRSDQPPGGYSDSGTGRTKGCTHNISFGGSPNIQYFPNAAGDCGTYNFNCICKECLSSTPGGCAPPSPSCCKGWVQTLDCQGDGPIDTGSDYKLDHTGKGFCTTTINPGSSGYCLCADGSKQNIVNCGHEPFVCEDVCKPYCTPTPPAPPPPPPSCATFLSHNDCPTGTTSKAANTTCGANSTGDCDDFGKCGCKCYLTDGQTAGQPRCLPSTSNTGKGRWPNTQAHDYNANMNCGTCLPRSTEADCNAAGGLCYWGVPSEDAIPGSCPGENCTSSDCCTPNPQCSSLGSCPPYSSMINPSLVCGDTVCNNTIGGECCAANPVCTPDVCDLKTQVFTGAGVKCVGHQCSKIECCKSRAKCSEGVTCNPDLYNKVDDYSSKYCKDVMCELSECCKADPTCHNYTCPQYYTDKTSMSSIKCGVGQACGTEKCCDLNPTCSSYFTGPNGAAKNGGCPAHQHLKKDSANIRCKGPKCTIEECCGADAKCSSFKCHENNLYHTYTHVANAAGIPCTNDHCTQKQCCVATPTYALPNVQTYPIYKTNMFHHGGGSTLNQ